MNGKYEKLVLACLLMAPATALAYPVQGPGAMSCAQFAKMYQADPSSETIFYTWAQGFWSSMNLTRQAAQGQMRDLGGDDNRRALRAFCANNPLKDYMDGILETYGKLPLIPKISN